MARYIDREKIKAFIDEKMEKSGLGYIIGNQLKAYIKQQPTADVEEVKHGEWIISSDGYYPYCSNCRYEPPFVGGKDMRTSRCPKCGAKMDEGC